MKLMQMQTKSKPRPQEEKSCSKAATKSITKKSTTHITPPASKNSPKTEITGKKSTVLESGEVTNDSNGVQDLVLNKSQQKVVENNKGPEIWTHKVKLLSTYEKTEKNCAKNNTKKLTTHITPPASKNSPKIEKSDKKSTVLESEEIAKVSNPVQDPVLSKMQQNISKNKKELKEKVLPKSTSHIPPSDKKSTIFESGEVVKVSNQVQDLVFSRSHQ